MELFLPYFERRPCSSRGVDSAIHKVFDDMTEKLHLMEQRLLEVVDGRCVDLEGRCGDLEVCCHEVIYDDEPIFDEDAIYDEEPIFDGVASDSAACIHEIEHAAGASAERFAALSESIAADIATTTSVASDSVPDAPLNLVADGTANRKLFEEMSPLQDAYLLQQEVPDEDPVPVELFTTYSIVEYALPPDLADVQLHLDVVLDAQLHPAVAVEPSDTDSSAPTKCSTLGPDQDIRVLMPLTTSPTTTKDVPEVLVFDPGPATSDADDVRDQLPRTPLHGVKMVMATDLLTLFVGSAQLFGVPMGYEGPQAAFLATSQEYERLLPSPNTGVTIDSSGKPALVMTMQTWEQHIYTVQALLTNKADMYVVYQCPEELKCVDAYAIAQEAAKNKMCVCCQEQHMHMLKCVGVLVRELPFFATFKVKCADAHVLSQEAVKNQATATTILEDVDKLFTVFSVGTLVNFIAESLQPDTGPSFDMGNGCSACGTFRKLWKPPWPGKRLEVLTLIHEDSAVDDSAVLLAAEQCSCKKLILMFSIFAWEQQLHITRQELSHVLYQHDAACRVIARLKNVRDSARPLLTQAEKQFPVSVAIISENDYFLATAAHDGVKLWNLIKWVVSIDSHTCSLSLFCASGGAMSIPPWPPPEFKMVELHICVYHLHGWSVSMLMVKCFCWASGEYKKHGLEMFGTIARVHSCNLREDHHWFRSNHDELSGLVACKLSYGWVIVTALFAYLDYQETGSSNVQNYLYKEHKWLGAKYFCNLTFSLGKVSHSVGIHLASEWCSVGADKHVQCLQLFLLLLQKPSALLQRSEWCIGCGMVPGNGKFFNSIHIYGMSTPQHEQLQVKLGDQWEAANVPGLKCSGSEELPRLKCNGFLESWWPRQQRKCGGAYEMQHSGSVVKLWSLDRAANYVRLRASWTLRGGECQGPVVWWAEAIQPRPMFTRYKRRTALHGEASNILSDNKLRLLFFFPTLPAGLGLALSLSPLIFPAVPRPSLYSRLF